jgi:Ca2+-binding EF-hand superfamily protein
MASSSYMHAHSYELEIRHCFDALDDDRTGTIPPHGLTTLLRSLGLRVTRDDVVAELNAARERRRKAGRTGKRRGSATAGKSGSSLDVDNNYNHNSCSNDGEIDVELVVDITSSMLSQERCRRDGGVGFASKANGGSSSSSSARAAEFQDTFRLFDVDNKGVITVENLRTVAGEVYAGGSTSSGEVDDGLLQSMIETFDGDLTGGINFEQFCRIMGGERK